LFIYSGLGNFLQSIPSPDLVYQETFGVNYGISVYYFNNLCTCTYVTNHTRGMCGFESNNWFFQVKIRLQTKMVG